MLPLTWGEKKIFSSIKMSQNIMNIVVANSKLKKSKLKVTKLVKLILF